MNFFQTLYDLHPNGQYTIAIKCDGDGKMAVSILCQNKGLETPKILQPLNFRESPAEMDRGFLEAIQKPVATTVAFFTNENAVKAAQAAVEQEAKKAKEKTATKSMEKAKQAVGTTLPPAPVISQYEQQMQKVEKLVEQKKYREAMLSMPKPADFPEHAEAIEKRKEQLWVSLDASNLFAPSVNQ